MKDSVLQIRISSEDKQKIVKLAKKNGFSLTDFIIMKCNDNCNDKKSHDECNDKDYIFNLLTEKLKDSERQISNLQNTLSKLHNENSKLSKEVKEPKLIEVGAFDENSVNHRPNINIFVDWIGYSMFIRNANNLEKDKEKKQLYQEVWSEHIKPMYKEFCEKCK